MLCAGGAGVAAFGLFGTPADAGATYTPASVTTVPPRLTHDPRAKPLARSIPVSIRIPGIYVDAPVMEVGKNADGTVQVPPLDDHNLTGWYRYGPTPGQRGAAVILGHVDSLTSISVFFYLKDLHAGDRVYVTLADGKVATFAVDGVQKVDQGRLPDRLHLRQGRLPQPAADHLRRPLRQGHRPLPGQHHRLRAPDQGLTQGGLRLPAGA